MSYPKKTKAIPAQRNNAVIYARYSSSSQQDQSIDGQIREIEAFAKRQSYRIIDTYIDRAMTGRNDDRPDFQRMLNDSFKGAFDYVIVYKLDRFSRDRYDSAVHKRTLRNNGVKVVSASETISDTPEGILFESMLEGYNEYYSAELAKKVRRGLNESRIKGNFTGGYVLYGYEIVDQKWTVKPSEAENVRKMFKDCANGVLIKDIAAALNEKGHRTNRDKPFTVNIISRILNNEKYSGILRYGDEVFTNVIPAVVDEELYQQVTKNMTTNARRTAHFRAPIPFHLSGKLKCMHCGASMNGESGTGRYNVYYYYKCQCNKKSKGTCEKENVRRDMLEDLIVDKTQQYILQPKYIMTVAAEMSANFNAKVKSNTELSLLKKAQMQNEKELQNTLAAIRAGLMTQSTKEMLLGLEDKKEKLAVEIAKLSNRKATLLDTNDCADFLFSLTALDYAVPENRKMLFDRFIRRVELGNRKIRIFFNPVDKPFLYTHHEIDFLPPEDGGEHNDDANNDDSGFSACSSGDALNPPRATVFEASILSLFLCRRTRAGRRRLL